MKRNAVWPQLRLSWWITLGIAAIVLITTLLLLLVVDQFARNDARHQAETRLKHIAWQMRDTLDLRMKERIVNIKDLSQRGLLGRHFSDPANNRYQADILIVRDDGVVLFGPKELEGKKIKASSLELARKGQSGALVEQWGGSDNTRYITGYVRTGMWAGQAGLNWSILVRQSEHVVLADILVLEKQMLIVATLEFLLLMVCVILLSYKSVAPMNALRTALKSRVSDEELLIPVGWSYYEFTHLSSALGGIVKREDFESKVNARIRQIREAVAGLPKTREWDGASVSPVHYRDRSLFA